jgi:mannosyltransferase OCH1-like enzyme
MLLAKNNPKDFKNIKKKIVETLKLKLYRMPYTFFKNIYNPIMPLKIFQTWYTKNLPPKMKKVVENLKSKNPKFEHYLFDDNDCRVFIKANFPDEVLNAYDSLIPGAYKADLWRYCVLYIYGGIYLDIKLNCINGFKLIELTEKNHFVKDRQPPLSIYNALLACQKNHPFLLMAINQIVQNVKNKFYGNNPLYPTGPQMLGSLILKNNLKINIDMEHYINGSFIIYKNRFVISTEYPEYNSERKETYKPLNLERYNLLWNEKKIYK